jgi:hypothetical protein
MEGAAASLVCLSRPDDRLLLAHRALRYERAPLQRDAEPW